LVVVVLFFGLGFGEIDGGDFWVVVGDVWDI